MNEQEALKKLGENIRKKRIEKKMQQVELAYLCGMDKGNMYKIEFGKTNITFKTLYKISQALEVSMSDLFDFN